MAELDILHPQQTVENSIYLEACAGAGKTFTIEHLVVRLLCHPDPLQRRRLDEIGVITFTRAAASDLRRRLEQCMRQLVKQLSQKGPLPRYLADLSDDSLVQCQRALELALFTFDRAWIGTIHGFCSRLLRRFGTGLADLVRASQDQLLPAAVEQEWILEFLRYGLSTTEIGHGQWSCLARHFKSAAKLADTLRQHQRRADPAPPWSELQPQLLQALASAPIKDPAVIHTLWLATAPGFKQLANRQGEIHANWLRRSEDFASLVAHPTEERLHRMVREGCPWLEAFTEGRKKARPRKQNSDKGSTAEMPSSQWSLDPQAQIFLLWAQNVLAPPLRLSRGTHQLVARIQLTLTPLYRRWLAQAGCTQPDALVERVRECAADPSWCQRVGKELRTLIVDEFQDTDPQQWQIFSALHAHLQLVLVGDPKQSIYAFREADLYTYLAASKSFQPDQRWTLTRCYRSSKPVIDAINWVMEALEGMDLPRLQSLMAIPTTLPREDPPSPLDAPGITWAIFEEGKSRGKRPSHRLMDREILPALIEQALDLARQGLSWERMAVIVRDRYQAAQVADALAQKGIPSYTARGRSWSDRRALPVLRDLIETLCSPDEDAPLIRVLASPLAGWSPDHLRAWRQQPHLGQIRDDLLIMQQLLFQDGLMAAMGKLRQCNWTLGPRCPSAEMEWADLMADLWLLAESLSSLEIQTPTLGRLWPWTIQEVMAGRVMLPEEAAPSAGQAVPILTIHMSKGLEFDAVFCLGLCSRTPRQEQEDPAEVDAEKLRQLYVALTRAKRFLWVPIILDTSGQRPQPGECAPTELLLARLIARDLDRPRRPIHEELDLLEQGSQEILRQWIERAPSGSMGLQKRNDFPHPPPPEEMQLTCSTPNIPSRWPSVRIWSSFTAEADPTQRVSGQDAEERRAEEPKAGAPLLTMPRGKEFGILWHELMQERLERLDPFSAAKVQRKLEILLPDWPDPSSLALNLVQGIEKVMQAPLWKGKSLQSVPLHLRRSEVPFLLADASGALKGWRGSIDAIVEIAGDLVAIDWKTHDLGQGPLDYKEAALRSALEAGDYGLQARLYLAALQAAGWRSSQGSPPVFLFAFVRGIALGAPAWISWPWEDVDEKS